MFEQGFDHGLGAVPGDDDLRIDTAFLGALAPPGRQRSIERAPLGEIRWRRGHPGLWLRFVGDAERDGLLPRLEVTYGAIAPECAAQVGLVLRLAARELEQQFVANDAEWRDILRFRESLTRFDEAPQNRACDRIDVRCALDSRVKRPIVLRRTKGGAELVGAFKRDFGFDFARGDFSGEDVVECELERPAKAVFAEQRCGALDDGVDVDVLVAGRRVGRQVAEDLGRRADQRAAGDFDELVGDRVQVIAPVTVARERELLAAEAAPSRRFPSLRGCEDGCSAAASRNR